MTKRPRDFDIQCQLDDITTELKKAKKQVRVAQSNVEATESAKDALKARVDKIKQKLETPGLSEQEKAALIAKRKKRVANLQYVDKELQLCMEVSQLRSKKLELLKEMEQLLLNWLDETPVDDAATAMMARLRELRGRLLKPGGVMDFPSPGLLFDPKATQVYIRDCYKPLFKELVDSTCKDIIS
eukprot:XP_001695670.1 predicted protein [Chlamydomonas reinhardtii]